MCVYVCARYVHTDSNKTFVSTGVCIFIVNVIYNFLQSNLLLLSTINHRYTCENNRIALFVQKLNNVMDWKLSSLILYT